VNMCLGFLSATDKILGETDNSVRVGQKTAIFRKVNQHNPTAHHDALDDRPGCGLAGGTPLLRMSGQCVGCRSAESLRRAPLHTSSLPRRLAGYRLKCVLDHIGDNLAEDLSLPVLASLAGMSQLGERHARSAYDLCTDVVYHCGPRAPPHLDPGTYLYHYV
jgi:hypothetical protein